MAGSAVDSWLSELDQAIAESVDTTSSGALLVLRNALEERRGQDTFTGYSIHQTTTSPIIPLPSWVPRPVAEFAGWRCELRPLPVLISATSLERISKVRCNRRGVPEHRGQEDDRPPPPLPNF